MFHIWLGWGILLRALWHLVATLAAGDLQNAGEGRGLWYQGRLGPEIFWEGAVGLNLFINLFIYYIFI